MRALLTGGIKAILGIAAISTAAHWTLRVQRESASASPIAAFASTPDPVATGSIEPRRGEDEGLCRRGLPGMRELHAGPQRHLPEMRHLRFHNRV